MIEKLLSLAEKQLGITENPANSSNVKYNTEYYGGEVNNSKLHWCVVFIWWLFKHCDCSDLFFGGEKTASCPTLYNYHKGQSIKISEITRGDIAFFNFSGGTSPQHVGIVVSCDGNYISTIDGNTGTGSEANGGAVMLRTRPIKYAVCAYRPNYSTIEKEDTTVTQEQFDAMMENYLARRNAEPEPDWSQKLGQFKRAKELGITDGTRPLGLMTRVEGMTAIVNLLDKLNG